MKREYLLRLTLQRNTRHHACDVIVLSRKKPVMVRVLSDQSVNIDQLVRVLYFGPCFVLCSVVLW